MGWEQKGAGGLRVQTGGGAAGEGVLQGSPLLSQHVPRELPLPLGGHSPDGAEHRLQVLRAQLLLQHGQAEHLSLGGLGAPPCSALGLLVPVEAHRPPQHRQDSCTAGSSLQGGVCASQHLLGALTSGWDSRGAGLCCGSGSPGGGFLTHEHLPISPFPHFPQTEIPLPSSDAQAGRYHLPVHTPPSGLADSLLHPPTSRFPLSS